VISVQYGVSAMRYIVSIYTVKQKYAPSYFCNSFVECLFIRIIIGTHILYHSKFGTKWHQNHQSLWGVSLYWLVKCSIRANVMTNLHVSLNVIIIIVLNI